MGKKIISAKLCISPTGKYFASILISGEVNIYTTLKVLEGDLSRTPIEIERSGTGIKSTSVPLTVSSNQRPSYKNKLLQSTEALSSVNKQVRNNQNFQVKSFFLNFFLTCRLRKL